MLVVVCQYRQGTYHLWNTIGDIVQLDVGPVLVDLLRGEGNEALQSDTICCNTLWEDFKRRATAERLLDWGTMTFETFFLKNPASLLITDASTLLALIAYAFPWCGAHGLDNVRLVFGFEAEELSHGI